VEARPHQSQLSLRVSTHGGSISQPRGNTERVHTMALHDTEEFHHDLRRRANKNLALSTALSVDHVFLQGQHSGQRYIFASMTTCQTVVLYAPLNKWISREGCMEGNTVTHKDRHADHFQTECMDRS
jgi:hypothetical protein